uniref:Uncharacterized protein LOC105123669 n=1 Tax=Rhizophora mucronata TaxID=61149 RepID=A0A2P2MEG7_RHIMU
MLACNFDWRESNDPENYLIFAPNPITAIETGLEIRIGIANFKSIHRPMSCDAPDTEGGTTATWGLSKFYEKKYVKI